MSAQVHSRPVDGGEPTARRRKKVTAFALAGLVATAGIAGVVVTSSAYFTDVKEIGTNTITVRGVDIEAYPTNDANTALTSFDLAELAPLAGATASEFDTAPSRAFDVRNISTSDFKYKVEIVDIAVTQKNGSALPTSANTSTALTADNVRGVIKANAVRAVKGTANPTYTAADGKTLTQLVATSTILPDVNLTKKDDTATTDEAVLGVRFWIEQSSISGWTTADQNLLQNVKVTYKIKLTATQL